MSLFDTARGIDAKEVRRKREEAERAQQVSLFDEQKDRWIEELSQAIRGLCCEFNSVVRDETIRLQIEQSPATTDKIRVVLLGSELKACELVACTQKLRIECSFITPKGTSEEIFEVVPSRVKGIQVRVFRSKSRTVWADEEGRKLTGDLFQDLRTVRERYPETVGIDEFADFVLDSFVKRFVRC